jgi:aspartyl-tRNA(Asn)/glutamyl-tRNA(Gln) amidotransferase subunit B
MEEDAGKSLHDRVDGRTAIDLNRAGTPLIEIVTEPDVVSPAHAREFLGRLKQVLEYLEVSDCDMEKGSLRVDANVSVRPAGTVPLGTKTELKNMNSFSNVERALEFEIARQTDILDSGRTVAHETLLWDERRGEVRSMRSKEESHDYRYFPEPDLPPLVIAAERIALLRDGLAELPHVRERRFRQLYGLPDYDAGVLTASRAIGDFYERVADACGDPKAASNWVMTDVLGWLNQRQLAVDAFPITSDALAGLIGLTSDGTLSSSLARRVFARMIETGRSAADIVEAESLAQVRDAGAIETWVAEVVAEHPDEMARLHDGETKILAFLMGQVMRKSGGKADPRVASEMIRERAAGEA